MIDKEMMLVTGPAFIRVMTVLKWKSMHFKGIPFRQVGEIQSRTDDNSSSLFSAGKASFLVT